YRASLSQGSSSASWLEPSVRKGIVDGHFIRKRHNPQVSTVQLRNFAPESIAVVLLRFRSERLVKNPSAPFLLDVRTLAEDLLLKVLRKAVFSHFGGSALSGA